MTVSIRVLLTLALLLFAARGEAVAVEPLVVTEVAPGVFVHQGEIALMSEANQGGIANVGFIVGSEGVAVIDTGGSVAEGRALLAAIRAKTDKPIRYVINTHAHPDHVFGNAAFADLEPLFLGSGRMRELLLQNGSHYIEANRALIGEALIAEVKIITPTLSIENKVGFKLGDRVIELRTWPTGHTSGDLTVFDPTTGTLFAGDLVFIDHVPALDGSIRGWLGVLDQLAELPAARVVPGHGPASAPWPEALADERRYLEAVASGVRALIANGTPIDEAPGAVAQEESERWQLFDEFHARNVTAAFAELEWE